MSGGHEHMKHFGCRWRRVLRVRFEPLWSEFLNACSAGLQVKTKHGKHENFVAPKPAGRDGKGGIKDAAKCFGIRHYAGEVGRP